MAKALKARKPGRPPNIGESVPLHLGIPKHHYAYLTLLAKRHKLGVSEAEVATHILVRELDALERAKYHDSVVPEE